MSPDLQPDLTFEPWVCCWQEMRLCLRHEGLAPKHIMSPPCAFLLALTGFHSQHWVFVWYPIFSHHKGVKGFFFLTPSDALCPPSQFRKGSPPHPHTPHTLSPCCLLPTPQERADVDLKEEKSTSAALLWSLVIHRAGWGESTGKEGGEKATRDILYNSKAQRSVQTGNRQLS